MIPEWFMTVVRNDTRVFITSLAALILGLFFFFLIPIEVWYFRILGAIASVTPPGERFTSSFGIHGTVSRSNGNFRA